MKNIPIYAMIAFAVMVIISVSFITGITIGAKNGYENGTIDALNDVTELMAKNLNKPDSCVVGELTLYCEGDTITNRLIKVK